MIVKNEMCKMEMYINDEKTHVVIKQTFSLTQVAELLKVLEALFEASPLEKLTDFPPEALEFLKSVSATEH